MKRDFDSCEIKHDNDGECVTIVSVCDGAVHPVTRHCGRKMLVQSTSILSSHSVNEKTRNLATLGDLLSVMSSNGEESVEKSSQIFDTCFTEKKKH